jgi:signal transduction histidine kinase
MQRKTALIFGLALALVVALSALVLDDELRDRLGSSYYILALAIIGCVLLLLTGYSWDRSLMQRVKSLREGEDIAKWADNLTGEADHDEIIGLARKIERMARSLQQAEASYRGIVEDQVDLICRCLPDGTVTFANGAYARAFGGKRADLVGQPFPFFNPGGAMAGEPIIFEREMALPDGRQAWIQWTQRAIGEETEKPAEYQMVGHDITVRKEAEAALVKAKEAAEAADRAKSEFLAVVSHELRTPINGVIGFAKMLGESKLNGEQKEQVDMIHMSGQALEKIIADILDFSKIEAGRIEIEHSPFSPGRSVDEVCSFFMPKARAASLALEFKVDSEIPSIVNGDETRVKQILTNLVGNAIKFTERGKITVQASCARGEPISPGSTRRFIRVFFAVTDTGIGIPAEKLKHLFLPFSQVDASSKRRRGGTGLGLIISKRLCERMGGTISVDTRPGEGSTFRFSILADFEEADAIA